MPSPRHRAVTVEAGAPVEFLSPEVWIKNEWGLANRSQDDVLQILLPDVQDAAESREIALDHLRKCLARARQFFAALDRPATPPPDCLNSAGLPFHHCCNVHSGESQPTLHATRAKLPIAIGTSKRKQRLSKV